MIGRSTQDVIGLVEQPTRLGVGNKDLWLAGKIREDVGFPLLRVLACY